MKKDVFLFIFAGFVLGSVVTFVVMKGIESKNDSPAPVKQEQVQNQNASSEQMDPNQHQSMMQQFIESAKNDPKNLEARITLANIYYDRGKFEEAIKWYEESLAIDPKNTDVLVDLGVCYREKDPKKSIEMFDKALLIDPKKQQALFNKVVVYLFDLKDIGKAKKSLEALKENYPDLKMIKELEAEIKKAEEQK
jgi:tetratricopeptide (TPR) repeat protein